MLASGARGQLLHQAFSMSSGPGPAIGAPAAPALSVGRLPLHREALVPLLRDLWLPAALAAILLLAAVVRVYDIGANPPGFFADEASYGYNAYTILHTGKDEYGARLPLFFQAFGEYKLPVYTYSIVPFIAVFGLTEVAVRLTSALYGVLTVLAVYLLVRALFQQRGMALAAAAILAILPLHLHYSRTRLGEIIAFPFFL